MEPSDELRLVPPNGAMLPAYAAALEKGWSPNTLRDVSAEQLAALRHDAAAFLRDLTDENGTVLQPDGSRLPRIPFRVFWLFDGDFCGTINLRFLPGTEALPLHVSGHVGYAVVPWKRRHGYATRALGLLLPLARAVGLRRVLVTCDEDNILSRNVILANGGISDGSERHDGTPTKLRFWVATGGAEMSGETPL
jgi:predicted acetyltransferase